MLRRYVAQIAGRRFEVEVDLDGDVPRVSIDGQARSLDVREHGGGAWSWTEGSSSVFARVDRNATRTVVTLRADEIAVDLEDARTAALKSVASRVEARPAGPLTIKAPMPGRVVKLLVKAGDRVTAGQGLAVVEAMKMENELKAPRAGAVAEILATEGTAVEAGASLVVLG